MTRVAMIAGTYIPQHCGVAQYTAHLCASLREYDVRVTVLTTYYAAEAAFDPYAVGVVHGWRLADLLSLVKAISLSDADILHIQHAAGTYGFQRAIFLLPMLLRLNGWQGKIVTTVHEYGWWEWQPRYIPPQLIEGLKMLGQSHGWWDREDGFLLTLSNAVITTNTDAEAVILQRLPKLANCLFRIPIAANVEVAKIDRDLARHLLCEKSNWAEDSKIIAFFGFLHPVKGLETLLPAFKQVLATQPKARLLLVGGVESLALSGEDAKKYWTKLHALISELNLDKTVHLTGYVSDREASYYLTGSDFGVLPFNHGLTLKSGSLLTMLAHGLPTVATQHGTSLPDGHPVQLVPPRDVDALAAKLLEMLDHSDMHIQLGEAGRSFAQNFSWQSVAKAHLPIYEQLL